MTGTAWVALYVATWAAGVLIGWRLARGRW
jgi:hypothetical protein